MANALRNAYLFHRTLSTTWQGRAKRQPARAVDAITRARDDVATGVRRYPAEPASASRQDDGRVYLSKPEAFGLRLVGKVEAEPRRGSFWSDRDTCGWYTDPDGGSFNDGTGLCWGVVYQLPGRDGHARFVAGYVMGGSDGDGATFDLREVFSEDARGNEYRDDYSAAREAAYRADSMAQRAAEEEHGYQTAWRAGINYALAGENIAEQRKAALELLKDRRAARGAESKHPAICAAIRRAIESALDTIAEARAKRAELADSVYGEEHKAAFCDGAGLARFPA